MVSGAPTPQWQRDEWGEVLKRRSVAFSKEPLAEPEEAATSQNSGNASEKRSRDASENSSGSASDQSSGNGSSAEPENLVGLSLSGGGIRSALYNDGFLQGLSHRGFLRYVDYICSVSGGGYITGHLISQASDSKASRESFHNDKARRDLGRDPETGKVDPKRLAGIGGYLSRTFEFLPAYLWSFLFSFAFYMGTVGVVASLVAILWRTVDDAMFRTLYLDVLSIQTGEELLIAFLPTLFLAALTLIGEVAISLYRCYEQFEGDRARRVHIWFRKASLATVVFAILTSIAIYLGNGITNIRSNAESNIHLNNYAQFFAISAAVIQILIFMGRDRLFRSERGEAKQWQKYLQQAITTSVFLFLVFSMIHWMGRENISGYTLHRDPQLVRGDIQNWKTNYRLFSGYEASLETPPEQAMPELPAVPGDVGFVDQKLRPESTWVSTLADSRLGAFDKIRVADLASPPSGPQEYFTTHQPWSLPSRIYGAGIAYYLSLTSSDPSGNSLVEYAKEIQELESNKTDDSSIHYLLNLALVKTKFSNLKQDKLVQRWNQGIESAHLTKYLLDYSRRHDGSASDSETLPAFLSTILDPKESKYGELDRNTLIRVLNSLQLADDISERPFVGLPPLEVVAHSLLSSVRGQFFGLLGIPEITPTKKLLASTEIRRMDIAKANRMLLESTFPGAIRRIDDPSTHVVPSHDQRARKRWLAFWLLVLLVGLIGGLGPYRVSTVFQFYRKQLGTNFLRSTLDPKSHATDTKLCELKPTEDGLPYPLLLAASLTPSTRNGSYRVDAQPFLFTPKFSGNFDDGASLIKTKQYGFSRNSGKSSVTLGDAVTLSGAAITPLMTENRWFSVLMDFFNTGIGQRLRHVQRTDEEVANQTRLPATALCAAGIGLLFGARWIVDLSWLTSGLFSAVFLLFGFCLLYRIGSPGLLRSLILPEIRYSAGVETTDLNPRSAYVADGGYSDYLGVSELLRRRCQLIVVSDAGANIGNDPLGTLARMCEDATQESGIKFYDLDHEAPIDFGRLEVGDQRLVHQPYLCMRVRYPEPEKPEGLLFYCQMSITESDPIEIKQIRNMFPSFPDEPTVNQFYSEKQVRAYRTLGYYIANRLCNELQPWQLLEGKSESAKQFSKEGPSIREGETSGEEHLSSMDTESITQGRDTKGRSLAHDFLAELSGGSRSPWLDGNKSSDDGSQTAVGRTQPLFPILQERLLTAYRLACYEERSYREDDIYREAIWPNATFAFPGFQSSVRRIFKAYHLNEDLEDLPNRWLREYERSADLRSAYRTAVIRDINSLDIGVDCLCEKIWSRIAHNLTSSESAPSPIHLAAHLTNIGTACQEVQRGRPHSTFQIGGRKKLIELSKAIAKVIHDTFDDQAKGRNDANLLRDMDKVIAELIELERSVFQGGEHVTTISFAQCMSAMWGKIVRTGMEKMRRGPDEEMYFDMLEAFLGNQRDRKSKSTENTKSLELKVAELRSELHKGLQKLQLNRVRDSLAKSWYLGFFSAIEIEEFVEGELAYSQEDEEASQRRRSKTKNASGEKIH